MNYWKHSLLSKKKFNGSAEDYLHIHKFIDTSKLFRFDFRHRILLHNTYGIEVCIEKFGDTLVNSDGQTILIRDIAAEHCREDLMGFVPTLNHWFRHVDNSLLIKVKPLNPSDVRLKEFVMKPLLMSGLQSTLIITHSNFGIYLAKEILGVDYAIELSNYIGETNIQDQLLHIKLKERWQYSPDLKQLKNIENDLN